MAMTTGQFLGYINLNSAKIQREMYRDEDLDVNGDEEILGEFSDEIENYPIGIPRARGLRGCLGD